jgi:hypothetical protein
MCHEEAERVNSMEFEIQQPGDGYMSKGLEPEAFRRICDFQDIVTIKRK